MGGLGEVGNIFGERVWDMGMNGIFIGKSGIFMGFLGILLSYMGVVPQGCH